MTKTIILRFRDLVTPFGGSIAEHKRMAAENGMVWWSWWKRQTLLGRPTYPAFGFDSGSEKLYLTRLTRIALAPQGLAIKTPDPRLTPEFCHQGEYPAWFLYGPTFHEVPLDSAHLEYHSFPSSAEARESSRGLIGARVTSARQLRQVDATMYAVNFDEESFQTED
jgi:hypothetical protein